MKRIEYLVPPRANALTDSIIYALKDPRDNAVRYIGRTINPRTRFSGHMTCARDRKYKTAPVYGWIRELMDLGLVPILEELETVPPELCAESETWWIAVYLEDGADLLNHHRHHKKNPNPNPRRVCRYG